MSVNALPHPASGATNPAIVQVVHERPLPKGFTLAHFSGVEEDGDPHTNIPDRAIKAMFRRGIRPVANGVVMCPSDAAR